MYLLRSIFLTTSFPFRKHITNNSNQDRNSLIFLYFNKFLIYSKNVRGIVLFEDIVFLVSDIIYCTGISRDFLVLTRLNFLLKDFVLIIQYINVPLILEGFLFMSEVWRYGYHPNLYKYMYRISLVSKITLFISTISEKLSYRWLNSASHHTIHIAKIFLLNNSQ